MSLPTSQPRSGPTASERAGARTNEPRANSPFAASSDAIYLSTIADNHMTRKTLEIGKVTMKPRGVLAKELPAQNQRTIDAYAQKKPRDTEV